MASVAEEPKVAIGFQVFTRGKASRSRTGDWSNSADLQRARVMLEAQVGGQLRGVLEPELRSIVQDGGAAESEFDLADAFLEFSISRFQLRVGQEKTGFGYFESASRWKLHSLTRGLAADVVRDRLGFGSRRLGASVRLKLPRKHLPIAVKIGLYKDPNVIRGEDGVLQIRYSPLKALRITASGYARASAMVDGAHGFAGSLSCALDTSGFSGVVEGVLGVPVG